jgi:hypothetical protein
MSMCSKITAFCAIVLALLFAGLSGDAPAQPRERYLDEWLVEDPEALGFLVERRGSQFPRLSANRLLRRVPVHLKNRDEVNNAFAFELTGCELQSKRIRCLRQHPDDAAQIHIAVFVLGGPTESVPTGLSLSPQGNARSAIALADYREVTVNYAGAPPRVLNRDRVYWRALRQSEDFRTLPVALVLCLAAQAACQDRDFKPTNLADQPSVTSQSAANNEPSGVGAATNANSPQPATGSGGAPPRGIRSDADRLAQTDGAPSRSQPAPQALPPQQRSARPPAASDPQPSALPPSSGPPPATARQVIAPPAQDSRAQPGPPVSSAAPLQSAPPPAPPPPAAVPATVLPRPGDVVRPAIETAEFPSTANIALTIHGVPSDYRGWHLARVVISALAGGKTSGLLSINIDDQGVMRAGELKVRGELLRTLTLGGKRVAEYCDAHGQGCRLDLQLGEWVVYLDAVPEEQAAKVNVYANVQLIRTEEPIAFFKRLQSNGKVLNGITLPALQKEGLRRAHIRIHLLPESQLRLEVRDREETSKIIPTSLSPGEMALVNVGPAKWELRVKMADAENVPAVSMLPSAPLAGAPSAVRHIAHLVLEPSPVTGWSPEQVAQSMKRLLDEKAVQVVLQAGRLSGERPAQIVGKNLIVWSREVPPDALRNPQFDYVSLPSDVVISPVSGPVMAIATEGTIHPNDVVMRASATLPPPLLAKQWQVNIEALSRIYGQEQPARTNETCEFNLVSRSEGGAPTRLQTLSREGGGLRSPVPIEASRLLSGTQLALEVVPKGISRCLAETLPLTAWWKLENGVPTVSARVKLTPPGRWFLGLFAPQGIGAGMSGGAVSDAQNQITDSMIEYLDKWRERFFPSNDPTNAALGFDLALVSAADANTADQFAEAAVITGQYRQQKTTKFRIDSVGQQRLDAFIRERGAGGAPPFEALQRTIERYAHLFAVPANSELAASSVVFYVGAVSPNPDTCRDWKQMTAALQSKARVVAVAFASESAAGIRDRLGSNSQAVEESFASRSGYRCDSGNGSVLLLVPFPDLVARAPEITLNPVFRRLDQLVAMAQLSR